MDENSRSIFGFLMYRVSPKK